MRRVVSLLLALCALAGCGGPPTADAPAGPVELVERMRAGGLVLYLRHAATDMSQQDVGGAPLENCSTQRNLTAEGREQARRIGEAFRRLRIPAAPVLSSEYCRSLETARLAFARVVPEPLLAVLPEPGESGYREQVDTLRELLGAPPAAGSNRVLVGHSKNLEAAAGLELEEGELGVFEPLGGPEFRLAGRIPAWVWPQVADALAGE